MNKANPIALAAQFDKLTFAPNRRPDSADIDDAFARLSDYREGAVFIAHWAGESSWERHPVGDEILIVEDGEADLTLLDEAGTAIHRITAGDLFVVPQNVWHKFNSPGIKLIAITPQPTEHSIQQPSL